MASALLVASFAAALGVPGALIPKDAPELSSMTKNTKDEVHTTSNDGELAGKIAKKVAEKLPTTTISAEAVSAKASPPSWPTSTCTVTKAADRSWACCFDCSGCNGSRVCLGQDPCPACPAPPPSLPPFSPPHVDAPPSGCFAKDSTHACLLSMPTIAPEAAYAQCFLGAEPTNASLVRMADLDVGDLVLTSSATSSRIVANQHKAVDTIAEMLTLHTEGGTVSLTPDHAVFVDGAPVAATEAKVGSILSTGVVKRVTKSEGAIINPVTASGTILASDAGAPVLAASHPIWIAPLVLESSLARAVINSALFFAGDVGSIAQGVVSVLAKIAATLAVVTLARKPKPKERMAKA